MCLFQFVFLQNTGSLLITYHAINNALDLFHHYNSNTEPLVLRKLVNLF